MIYFDNSATSYVKPECVIGALTSAARHLSANPGRSGHSLSLRAGMLVYDTRKKAAALLGTESERIVFTSGCTQALNLAILGTVMDGGNVITTANEHNSVLRPLFELQRKGRISVRVVPPNERGVITAEAIERAITPRTYLVAVNHISNVTGATCCIDEIGKLCHRKGIKLLVDGAQSVGYGEIDVNEQNIDYLAVAPHKGLHALQGVGLLALGKNAEINPVFFGGTGTESESVFQPRELPESLEAGTLPTPAIAALNAAISQNQKVRAEHRRKTAELSAYLIESLKKIRGVSVFTAPDVFNGLVTFSINGIGSMDAANVLSSQYDIAVRGGLHCAPLIHRHLGTLRTGLIRASVNGDNTFDEGAFFLKAVQEIAETEANGIL